MTSALPPVRRRPAALVACLAALLATAAATPAAAHAGDRTPSAQELWQQYPLGPTPAASATSTPAAAPPATARREAAGTARPRDDSGGGFAVVWAVALATLAGAVVAAALVRRVRRSDAEPAPEPGATGPAPPHPPRHRQRFSREAPAEDANGSREPAGAVPPAPDEPWTAEIRWHRSGDRGSFAVVATSADGSATATLARSGEMDWPPSGASDVEGMTLAARALERWMLDEGWQAQPPGRAWYAKRFAWAAGPATGPAERPPGRARRGGIWVR